MIKRDYSTIYPLSKRKIIINIQIPGCYKIYIEKNKIKENENSDEILSKTNIFA